MAYISAVQTRLRALGSKAWAVGFLLGEECGQITPRAAAEGTFALRGSEGTTFEKTLPRHTPAAERKSRTFPHLHQVLTPLRTSRI